MKTLIQLIADKTTLNKNQIKNILTLLDKGDTIPFIVRYRKELTGGADDEQLRVFYDVYLSAKRLLERKEEIVSILTEREQLTATLKEHIAGAETMTVLEDIYRPYKEKKTPMPLVPSKEEREKTALCQADYRYGTLYRDA